MGQLMDLVNTHYAGMKENDMERALSVLADNVETIMPGGPPMHGIAPFREALKAYMEAIPDAAMTVIRTVEDGDTIAVEGVYSGTQTGPLATPGGVVPPTGRTVSLRYADIFRVRDGKVVQHHVYFDSAEMMSQLGLMPGA